MTKSTKTGKCFLCGLPSNPNGIGGRLERCAPCVVSAARRRRERWVEANPEADRAAKDAWAARNPEKVAANKDNWRKANLERFNETGKAWKKNPEAMFRYRLKRYGLTMETYAAMLAAQDGRCGICLKLFGEQIPCVDHHHGSNRTRALLCVRCNAGLGQFLEKPEVLEAAARYVRAHEGVFG